MKHLNSKETWEELMDKYNVFLIKKEYDNKKKEEKILKQWHDTIGE